MHWLVLTLRKVNIKNQITLASAAAESTMTCGSVLKPGCAHHTPAACAAVVVPSTSRV